MWSTPLLSLDKNGELVPALMGMPRAVHSAFVAPAVPNWKLFVYGGHGTDREKAVSTFFFFFFFPLAMDMYSWCCLSSFLCSLCSLCVVLPSTHTNVPFLFSLFSFLFSSSPLLLFFLFKKVKQHVSVFHDCPNVRMQSGRTVWSS